MNITQWTLKGFNLELIYGNTHLPVNDDKHAKKGDIIFCHGYKGYKDYGFFPKLAQAAAGSGWVAHRFNFSHSGMTNNIDTFERDDLFEEDTWSKQIYDLQAVTYAVKKGNIEGVKPLDNKPLVWFGHSRGALTTLLTAARAFEDKTGELIKPSGVISASSPDKPCSLSKEDKKTFHINGRMPVESSRTGQILYVGLDWLLEIENNPKAFDPLRAVKQIKCPVLFVHGDKDDAVPLDVSRNLYSASIKNNTKLKIIENASHTFNAPNPMSLDATAPLETRQLIKEIDNFLQSIS